MSKQLTQSHLLPTYRWMWISWSQLQTMLFNFPELKLGESTVTQTCSIYHWKNAKTIYSTMKISSILRFIGAPRKQKPPFVSLNYPQTMVTPLFSKLKTFFIKRDCSYVVIYFFYVFIIKEFELYSFPHFGMHGIVVVFRHNVPIVNMDSQQRASYL